MLGRSTGLVVMRDDSFREVVGSNPVTIYLMDIFTLICCKNCYDVCLKRPKLNEKEAGNWPIYKNN